jgi:hypothetical protein
MERAAPLTDRRGRSGSRRSVRSTLAEERGRDRDEYGRGLNAAPGGAAAEGESRAWLKTAIVLCPTNGRLSAFTLLDIAAGAEFRSYSWQLWQ